jgi:hypothetical protein
MSMRSLKGVLNSYLVDENTQGIAPLLLLEFKGQEQ